MIYVWRLTISTSPDSCFTSLLKHITPSHIHNNEWMNEYTTQHHTHTPDIHRHLQRFIYWCDIWRFHLFRTEEWFKHTEHSFIHELLSSCVHLWAVSAVLLHFRWRFALLLSDTHTHTLQWTSVLYTHTGYDTLVAIIIWTPVCFTS